MDQAARTAASGETTIAQSRNCAGKFGKIFTAELADVVWLEAMAASMFCRQELQFQRQGATLQQRKSVVEALRLGLNDRSLRSKIKSVAVAETVTAFAHFARRRRFGVVHFMADYWNGFQIGK